MCSETRGYTARQRDVSCYYWMGEPANFGIIFPPSAVQSALCHKGRIVASWGVERRCLPLPSCLLLAAPSPSSVPVSGFFCCWFVPGVQ